MSLENLEKEMRELEAGKKRIAQAEKLINNPFPIKTMIFIVLVIVFSYVAMSMNNAYDEIADDLPEFNIAANFPYTHLLMSNLAVLILGTLLSFGVGIFMSSKVGI